MRYVLVLAGSLLMLPTLVEAQDEDHPWKIGIRSYKASGKGNDWKLRIELRTTFPNNCVITVQPRMKRHVYNWVQDGFYFGAMQQQGMPGATVQPKRELSRSGRTSFRDIFVPTPGLYEFHYWFDPSNQVFKAKIEKTLGRNKFIKYEYSPEDVMIGDMREILKAMATDVDKAGDIIQEVKDLLDRIEKESEYDDWAERADKIFKEIGKLKTKADEMRDSSLMNATMQVMSDLLYELELVGKTVKMMKAQQAEFEASGGTGGGGEEEEPETEHDENGGDEPIIGTKYGKKMTLPKMKEHIERAKTIRLREFFSWIVVLSQDQFDRAMRLYTNAKAGTKDDREAFNKGRREIAQANDKTLRKAHDGMMKANRTKDLFRKVTTLTMDDKETRFEDWFDKFDEFLDTLDSDAASSGEVPDSVLEMRDELNAYLSVAREMAIGAKNKRKRK